MTLCRALSTQGTKTLRTLVKRVASAMGRDDTRPSWDGVEVVVAHTGDDPGMYTWATDGHRLHVATHGDVRTLVAGGATGEAFLDTWGVGSRVASRDFSALLSALDTSKYGAAAGGVALHVRWFQEDGGPDRIRVLDVGQRFGQRFYPLAPAVYGAIKSRAIIPQGVNGAVSRSRAYSDVDVTLDRAELLDLVKKAEDWAPTAENANENNLCAGDIVFHTTINMIGVRSADWTKSVEAAEWFTSADFGGRGGPFFSWRFRGKYVLDAIRGTFGKTVRLQLWDDLSPLCLSCGGDPHTVEVGDTFVAVVMPKRI